MKRSFRNLPVTPSYERVRQRFQSFTTRQNEADVGHLVLALLCEESLGGKCLRDLGITVAGIAEGCFGESAADAASAIIESGEAALTPISDTESDSSFDLLPADWFCRLHERAGFIARRSNVSAELSTEHLIQAMAEIEGPAKVSLNEIGISPEQVLGELLGDRDSVEGLTVDFDLNLDATHETQPSPVDAESKEAEGDERVLALLDANLNRAREGLRVLEDYVRFVQRNEIATQTVKSIRHELVDAELRLSRQKELLTYRNVEEDAGTAASTDRELSRSSMNDILRANARRVQEAFRSLEEFGKLVDVSFATAIKHLRYRSYEIEQLLVAPESDKVTVPDEANSSATFQATQNLREDRIRLLNKARLYVLLTEANCQLDWKEVVLQALKGGADVIQLREKKLSDEEIIERGKWISGACRRHKALFILNDRVDLVVPANADGVHLGQEDMSIESARRVLPSDRLIGLSTHNPAQLQHACDAGADYLGVGPVMSSTTKSFTEFAGLEFVRSAATNADRPWFAIGGINADSIQAVMRSGASRTAVSAAVIAQKEPFGAAAELKRQLRRSDQTVATNAQSESRRRRAE